MTTKNVKRSKTGHVGLWVVQILLAGMFLMVGYMKAPTPIAERSKTVSMAGEMPVLIRFIGVSELAPGLGLLLPAALRVAPRLTVAAAAGLAVVMVLAVGFPMGRGEYSAIGTNVVLGSLAGVVAWEECGRRPSLREARAQRGRMRLIVIK